MVEVEKGRVVFVVEDADHKDSKIVRALVEAGLLVLEFERTPPP